MDMDLLNQFAIHAPTDIPNWFSAENGYFEFEYPAFNLVAPLVSDFNLNESDAAILEGWLDDPIYDLGGYLEGVANKFVEFWDAGRDHEKAKGLAYIKHRYFAWRFYYAQMMINESLNGSGFGIITMQKLGELEADQKELCLMNAVADFHEIFADELLAASKKNNGDQS